MALVALTDDKVLVDVLVGFLTAFAALLLAAEPDFLPKRCRCLTSSPKGDSKSLPVFYEDEE